MQEITDEMVAARCQCTRLRAASRRITRMYDDVLRPLGIKANQFTMLIGTSLMGPVSTTNLANKLSMDRTTLTRNLLPLEKNGLILLESGHGRTRNALLTSKGKKLLKKAKPLWKTAQTNVESQLGDININKLNSILKLIVYEK